MNDTSNTSRWSAASLGSVLSAAARPRSLAKRLVRDYARKGYQPLAELLGTYPSPLVIDREELQAICRREGALTYYGTSKAVELTVPDRSDGPAALIERRAGEHLVPTPFVGELPGVDRKSVVQGKSVG